MKNRLLALINVALIPYVWWRFRPEWRNYAARSLRCVVTGKGDLRGTATPEPDA